VKPLQVAQSISKLVVATPHELTVATLHELTVATSHELAVAILPVAGLFES